MNVNGRNLDLGKIIDIPNFPLWRLSFEEFFDIPCLRERYIGDAFPTLIDRVQEMGFAKDNPYSTELKKRVFGVVAAFL